MRILHIQKSRVVGGIDRYVLDLAVHTAKAGHNVTVMCPRGSWLRRRILAASLPSPALPTFPLRALRASIAVWAIRKVIRQQSIDIIHSHDYHGAQYALLAAKAEGIPNIRTMHGTDIDKHSLAADRLICVSQAVVGEYTSRGINLNSKMSVVLFGTPTEDYHVASPQQRADARSALGVPNEVTPIGMVSRLVPHKGCREFVLTLAKIPGAWGLLFGYAKPRYKRELQELAEEMGCLDRLVFAGPIDDVRNAFAALDVTVMPSEREGFPLTMLESSACAVPVAAFSVGGIPQFIEDGVNGALAPPGDTDGLAGAIERMISDESTRQLIAKQARESVIANFDISRAVRDIAHQYELAIGAR